MPDIATVGIALSDVGTFPSTGERLMQGVINNLVMTRSFKAVRTSGAWGHGPVYR